MREIKFRAWDKKQKFMEVNGIMLSYLEGGLKCDGPCYYLSNGWVEGNINRDCSGMKDIEADVILMQYTGLKDKNGVEIYEGDILNNGNGPVYVFWNENYQAFWVGYDSEESEKQYYALTSDFCTEADEIIGNIYENPELLNRHC